MKKKMGKLLVLTIVLVLLVVLNKLRFGGQDYNDLTREQKMQQIQYYKNIDGLSHVHSFFVGANREFVILVKNSQGNLDHIQYRDPSGKLGTISSDGDDLGSGTILEQAANLWNNLVCQDSKMMKLIACQIVNQHFVPYNTKLGTCTQGLSQCVAFKVVELAKTQKNNENTIRMQGFIHNSVTKKPIVQGTIIVTQLGKQAKTINSYRADDGSFVTALSHTGTYKLSLNAQGYVPTMYHLVLTQKDLKMYNDDNEEIFSKDVGSEAIEFLMDLAMIPNAIITQKIVAKDTKEPIAGATIYLLLDNKQITSTKTNAQGNLTLIPPIMSGAVDMQRTASAEGYMTQEGIWSLTYDVEEGTNSYVVQGLEEIEMEKIVEDNNLE